MYLKDMINEAFLYKLNFEFVYVPKYLSKNNYREIKFLLYKLSKIFHTELEKYFIHK